ncbi:hypothetical protein CHS0354_039185, partial [Potamilus streckersoni]
VPDVISAEENVYSGKCIQKPQFEITVIKRCIWDHEYDWENNRCDRDICLQNPRYRTDSVLCQKS